MERRSRRGRVLLGVAAGAALIALVGGAGSAAVALSDNHRPEPRPSTSVSPEPTGQPSGQPTPSSQPSVQSTPSSEPTQAESEQPTTPQNNGNNTGNGNGCVGGLCIGDPMPTR